MVCRYGYRVTVPSSTYSSHCFQWSRRPRVRNAHVEGPAFTTLKNILSLYYTWQARGMNNAVKQLRGTSIDSSIAQYRNKSFNEWGGFPKLVPD